MLRAGANRGDRETALIAGMSRRRGSRAGANCGDRELAGDRGDPELAGDRGYHEGSCDRELRIGELIAGTIFDSI
jgi:hypothetical protein